jgi:signal transduction histidine kinase/CheY-like chemotaxis protein
MMNGGGVRPATLIFAAFAAVAAFIITWFPWREGVYARQALVRKAENQAALIAYTIAPALEFADGDMIREVFRGASRDVDFVGITAESVTGGIVAEEGAVTESDATIVTIAPIESLGTRLGTLRLAMSTVRVERESRENFMAAILISVTIIVLGILVSLWVARSIRQIATLTDQNARAFAVAQQAEVKSRFLANMSHEIRTPLNGVLGLADVLSRRRHDPQSAALIATILRSGQNLLALVNDVLDLARIESGRMEVERVPFDPEMSAVTVCESLMSTARARGLDLALDVALNVPREVLGDRLRFEQVMTNLVGNALKFTERGRVLVSLEWRAGSLTVAVNDTGIGIPASKLETIFEAFSQADASTTRRFGGTGLGLTISRELVRKMGGDLRVESVEGEGSTFSFDVPLAVSDSTETFACVVSRLASTILLVSEDHRIGKFFALSISRHGSTLEVIEPSALVARLERELPDIIVWDVRCSPPTAAIRDALARIADRARILVHASVVDEAPFDDIVHATLPRPFTRASFAKAIDLDARPATSARPTTSEIDPNLRILIAEDDETNRLVVQQLLGELGLRADFVVNGKLAVERVANEPYELVLMDCQMPEMDGYEAARQIRAWEKNADRTPIPIIAVTAHALEEERTRAIAAGMIGYLTKPLTLESFMGALWEHVPQAIREHVSKRPTSPEVERDARARIAVAFERSTEEGLSGIAAALSQKDWQRIAQLAHRVKGSCLSVGAAEAADLAAQLEASARDTDEAKAGELVVMLELSVVETGEGLRASTGA